MQRAGPLLGDGAKRAELSWEVVPGAGLCLEEMLLGQNCPGGRVLLDSLLLLAHLPNAANFPSNGVSHSPHLSVPRLLLNKGRSLALNKILVRDEDSQDQGGGSKGLT